MRTGSLFACLLAFAWMGSPLGAPEPGRDQLSALGPDDALAWATAAASEIRSAGDRIAEMAGQARLDGEQARLDCLLRRLSMVRALAEVADASLVSLSQSDPDTDRARTSLELRRLWVALTRTREILAEAAWCGGGSLRSPGDTTWATDGAALGLDGFPADQAPDDGPNPVSPFE